MLLTYLIEVKRKFARYRTIQSGLEVRGPILRQYILTTRIPFADSSHTGIHTFTTVYILDRGLAEKEEHVIANVIGTYEIWFCKKNREWKIIDCLINLAKCFGKLKWIRISMSISSLRERERGRKGRHFPGGKCSTRILPAEFMRFAVIYLLAYYLSSYQNNSYIYSKVVRIGSS